MGSGRQGARRWWVRGCNKKCGAEGQAEHEAAGWTHQVSDNERQALGGLDIVAAQQLAHAHQAATAATDDLYDAAAAKRVHREGSQGAAPAAHYALALLLVVVLITQARH